MIELFEINFQDVFIKDDLDSRKTLTHGNVLSIG